jgi:transcription elongation GreA/GreB family factor
MRISNVKELVAANKWDKLESAWLELIDSDVSLDGVGEVLEAVVAADQAELAETLASTMLEVRMESGAADVLDVARAVALAVPSSEELRSKAAELYRQAHGDHAHFDRLLAAAGLTGKQSTKRAIRTLDTCLAIEPGCYLVNRFDNQAVQATGYNEVMEQYDLTDARGQAVAMEPKLLADEFDLADETDFRVLSQLRKEQLAELIKKDLAAVLIGVCMANGGQIDATALKEQLAGKHVPSDKWSSWWGRARTAVKRTEQLTLEGKNPVTIVYHPHGRTVEEELADEVAKAYTPLQRLALLRVYVREVNHRQGELDATFPAPLLTGLAEQVGRFADTRPAEALVASLAICEAVEAGMSAPDQSYLSPDEIIARADSPAEAVAGVSEAALWPTLLAALADRDDAIERIAALLPLAPAELLDDMTARLTAAGRGEVVEGTVAEALADTARHLEVCIWLWQGPATLPPGTPGKVDLLTRLIGVLDDLHRGWDVDAAHRKAVSQRVRSALSAGGYAVYKAAAAEMDEGVAATVKRRIERCDGLAQAVRGDMLDTLKESFYALFIERKAQVDPWADENTLWTTEAALRAREAELKELVDVRMLENSRAVGAAAALGDLSENSEWKYAVQEQGRLNAAAAKMREELAKARAIHPGDVPTDHVGIGSRVTLNRGDGQQLEVRFLGPWDVDVASRVFSYHSDFGQRTMGNAPGDEVEVKIQGVEGTYRIETLGSALE